MRSRVQPRPARQVMRMQVHSSCGAGLADNESSPASDAGFFVFPNGGLVPPQAVSVRGRWNDVPRCKSIYNAPFYVSNAKKFPGTEDKCLFLATPSSRDSDIKIRIRKDIRMQGETCAGGQAASRSFADRWC
ncbi:hypothetical protein K438DRAFT_1955586 [Mycena galopus ATCC 62051]|nr:hypothetical protein K438DRAFT_1955586 [Mycena galopus ATCC 62051]